MAVNSLPIQELAIDKNVYIILGATILMVVISIVIYFLYKKYAQESEYNEDYDKSKTDLKIEINSSANKAIVNYLNTLEVVQGSDLINLQTEMESMIQNKLTEQLKKININKSFIRENRVDVVSNGFVTGINRTKIDSIEKDVRLLRQSVSYNHSKIIIRFMDEYHEKYSATPDEKDLVLGTNFFGLFQEDVYKLFDKHGDGPDTFIKTHQEELLKRVKWMLSVYNISDYYNEMESINFTNYGSGVLPIYTHIKNNSLKIDLKKHAKYIFNDYLESLLNYINSNEAPIRSKVDILMVGFYKGVPDVNNFNEFLTRLEVEDFIRDDNHLFTIIMKRVLENKFVNWANFSTQLMKYQIFSKETMKLLFVLIPEYLIMIKYQHMNNVTKYNLYINSKYFINMPEKHYINQTNIANFNKILNMFRCMNKQTNFNKKNEALKINLSENNTSLDTVQHEKFKRMIDNFNTVVRNHPTATDGSIVELDFDDFLCTPFN
jgi:hypothetical protein